MKPACVALILSSLIFAAMTLGFAQEEPVTSDRDSVRELLKEKRSVLEKRYTAKKTLADARGLGMEYYLDAEMDLLDAKLELSESEAEKVKVLQLQLKNREKLEQHWEQGARFGTQDMHEAADKWLLATAQRIDVQVAICRAGGGKQD